MIRATLALGLRQSIKIAQPSVFVGKVLIDRVTKVVDVPNLISIVKFRIVIKGLLRRVHSFQIWIGSSIYQDAKHLGVHIQHRHEQGTRTIGVELARISA